MICQIDGEENEEGEKLRKDFPYSAYPKRLDYLPTC